MTFIHRNDIQNLISSDTLSLTNLQHLTNSALLTPSMYRPPDISYVA